MANTLTPWNRQEEWYQEMINAQTGKYLPTISSADAGKVMTVSSDGGWEVDDIPSPLPEVAQTDKDKFLHTNSTTGALEWSAVQGGSGTSILPVEIENDLYTETLGEVVEFQTSIMGATMKWNGIEAVGMTADIASEIADDTTSGEEPAPMKYTYRIGDNIIQDAMSASMFIPILADDGKYYFVAENTVFSGASGEVAAVYKTALQFPPNVLCLYDPTDPKGDESYLPEYAEYDDGYWVYEDYDASAFYNTLTNGNVAYAVLPLSDSNNGYEYALVGSFYPLTDGEENYLSVSTWDAPVFIYNYQGASSESEIIDENSGLGGEVNADDGGSIVINPIGGGDHEMPSPNDGHEN